MYLPIENDRHREASLLPAKLPVFWGEMSACENVGQLYKTGSCFIEMLETFVRTGILAGESVIVVATQEHLSSVEERLSANNVDINAAREQDCYIPLVAEKALARFIVDGWPDDECFKNFMMDILTRARRNDRRVRAFGEMVALLWAQGDTAATVRLEHLWRQLCIEQSDSIFCAYPRIGCTESASESLAQICTLHARLSAG